MTEPDFLAHPIAFIKLQAETVVLPDIRWSVAALFAESYEAAALRWLKETMHIDIVIAGGLECRLD